MFDRRVTNGARLTFASTTHSYASPAYAQSLRALELAIIKLEQVIKVQETALQISIKREVYRKRVADLTPAYNKAGQDLDKLEAQRAALERCAANPNLPGCRPATHEEVAARRKSIYELIAECKKRRQLLHNQINAIYEEENRFLQSITDKEARANSGAEPSLIIEDIDGLLKNRQAVMNLLRLFLRL